LRTNDGAAPTEFSISSADGEFVPANALIEENTVLVRNSTISTPAAVRFAWHDTALPNLVNSAGLPALPFRTDDFQLLSDGN
jgi:sialate O-acetylesterase